MRKCVTQETQVKFNVRKYTVGSNDLGSKSQNVPVASFY